MKLIQFKAKWCGPCKLQTELFKSETHPLDVELEVIDVDEEDSDLPTKLNVRSIPTMILMGDDGQVLNRWTGVTKPEVINKFIHDLGGIGTPEGE